MNVLINVYGQKLKIPTNLKTFAPRTQKFIKFTFNLTDDWNGLLIFAQFRQGNKAFNKYLDESNSVYLPPEIGAGTCTLMLYGSGKDDVIGTTNYITLTLDDDRFISDANSTEISKSLYTQLVSMYQSLENNCEKMVYNAVEKEMAEYLSSGVLANMSIEEGSITPNKFDRSYWENPYLVITDYEMLDSITDEPDSESLVTPVNAIYTIRFYPATDLHNIFGDDNYFAFISEYVGREGTPKLTIINQRTFEMWTYLKGSKNAELFSPHINNGSITGDKIEPGAVDTDQIADGAVTSEKLGEKSVETANLATASVTGGKLADNAVNTGHIVDRAVTGGKLADNAVNTGHIVDGAVTEKKLAGNSVDYYHLKDMSVTPEKLDREYTRLHPLSSLAVRTESMFHNFLVTGRNTIEETEIFKMLSAFSIGVKISGILSVLETGRYYGFYISKSAFTFTSMGANPKTYLVIFTNEKITSVERVDLRTFSEDGAVALNTDGAVDGYSIENRFHYLINYKSDVNRHKAFFNISDDGELSLKEEFQAGGEKNATLPADLIIPGCINEIAVDRLSSGMFLENKVINSITLPDSVFEIPEQFCNMAVNLKCVNNTAHIKKIGDRAFRNCRLEKAVFPNLEEINGTLAFYQNSHLIFADVGKVAEIPSKTFKHCMYLSKLSASGGNVKKIGTEALYSTVNLRQADFMANVTSIEKSGVWQSKLEYDWDSLNCTFGEYATHRQTNPTDFWSGCVITPCENPVPTQLCQRDERWAGKQFYNDKYTYGNQGCLIMSSIHAVCGIHNLSVTTPDEFDALVNNADLWKDFYPNTDNLAPILNSIAQTAPEYKVTATYYNDGWTKERLQAMYDGLASGGYAIVETGTPAGHGIVVYGVTEKGELMCLDSEQRHFYDSSKPIKYTMPFHKLINNNSAFIFVTR